MKYWHGSIATYRFWVRLAAGMLLAGSIAVYYLYIAGKIDLRLLGVADLNPYGGWSALRQAVTDSSYEFNGFSRSIALTIAIGAGAILGGRFFCGWICPLGSLQDLFSAIGIKYNLMRRKPILDRRFMLWRLKYLVLFVILAISALGYGAALSGISPWRALLTLPDLVTQRFVWDLAAIGLIMLGVILASSLFISRPFCRYLCPLGAAQALLGAFSPVSIQYAAACRNCRVDEADSCKLLLSDCPVELDFEEGDDRVSPECIRCLRCVDQRTIEPVGPKAEPNTGSKAEHARPNVEPDAGPNVEPNGESDAGPNEGPNAWPLGPVADGAENCANGRLKIYFLNKAVSAKKYGLFLLAVFLSLWLGLPAAGLTHVQADGLIAGAYGDGTFYGVGTGFGGNIRTEIRIVSGKLESITIVDHHETRGWYEEAFKDIPGQLLKAQGTRADDISGATATSRGLRESVGDALKQSMREDN